MRRLLAALLVGGAAEAGCLGDVPIGSAEDAAGAGGIGGSSGSAGAGGGRAGGAGTSPGGAAGATTGTVWYVRLDGGTAAQCDGKTDAAYAGTGAAQPCAFQNPYYLWGDDVTYGEKPTWKIAGGDSVVFKGGPFRMGYKGPNDKDFWAQCPGDPHGCTMPPIPAGTAGKTTKLLGENFASCTSKTQLFGGFGLDVVVNLSGTQFVDVACLELTDHSPCSTVGALPGGRCNTSYPLDDYAAVGIATDKATAWVAMRDLDIHGFPSRAILGALGGPVTADHVRAAYNGGAGWDFDDGAGTPSAPGASVEASYLTVEWNGCNEQYPITDALPALSCFDQTSAGYGDGIGTPATRLDFRCDHCNFNHNTQDGLDLGQTSDGVVALTHSISYANMGQPWSLGSSSSVLFQNNVTVHDCSRMAAAETGAPADYNKYLSLFCRAAGDGITITLKPAGVYTFQNNTFAGYGSTSHDIACAAPDCTGVQLTYQNNLNIGFPNPADGKLPGLFYLEAGVPMNPWAARDHNIFYNFRNGGCPTGFANETCDSPQLVNQPTFNGEASLDAFDVHLSATSPARDAGTTIAGLVDDYFGTPRPQGPAYDIGAHEF